MQRSVKATAGLLAAALITATCTAASASAATHIRTVPDSNPTYFKMIGVPTAGDPGCATAASVGRQMGNTLRADQAAISRDQNNPSARRADLQHLVADLQSLQRQMTTAEARATHQSVKAGIASMISDLGAFIAGLRAIENGDMSQVNPMTTAGYRTQSNGHQVYAACTALSPPGRHR
jgi:hypothetical protein